MAQTLANLFDLSGRVALITGGSLGLGLQIAEALGEFGATIVLAGRKQHEIDGAVEHLSTLGISAWGIPADLAGEEAVAQLVEAISQRCGRLDILVNCAGATWGASAEDYPAQAWHKVMTLNVTNLFLLTQLGAKTFFLPRGRGVVVNIASIEGLFGHPPTRPGTVAYNASKGAVVNLTRALPAEWGPRGVRVNAIAPGFFPTKMTFGTLESAGEDIMAATPLGKLGGDSDLKGAALLLASDAGGT